MKLKQSCLTAGLALMLLPSCSEEAPWGRGNGEGAIQLNLSALKDIEAAVPAVRAVTTEIETPPVSDFKVKVTKMDGSYSQTFSSVEEFVSKESFTVGSYEIEAWYGEPDNQGFIPSGGKGYEHSYYYGLTSDITVLENQTTEVELSASLANAIVDIEYTEAYKNYFVDWNTTLQSAGKSPVSLGSAQGTSYVTPGEVAITISAEMHNGNQVTLNPGSFVTKPGHMYKMRYNIHNGEVGKVDQLVIEFDENLNTQPVRIDLSGELENTPAPVIGTEGFVNGQNFVTQEGTPFNGEMKFNVAAAGKINKAVLTIESDSYHPSYLTNGEIDLCAATEEQKAAMVADGIKAVGFFGIKGEMAQLDLTELCHKIPNGEHKFHFQVTDSYTQTNEPVSVSLSCVPIDMKMEGINAPFGEGYADLLVTYNGPDPTAPGSNPFQFRVQDNLGYSDAEVLSITKKETRAFENLEYIYRISVPDVDRDVFTVRGYFGEETANPNMEANVAFTYPEYKVLIDPMTRKLRIKVDTDNSKKETLCFHKMRVFVNGVRLNDTDKENFLRDEPTDQLIVYNLEPETTYNIKTTLYSDANTTVFGSEDNVTTSAELPVPNGDFSQKRVAINKRVQVGGQWTHGVTYTTTSDYLYEEPGDGWASVNQKTFYNGATNFNSWFTVASTFCKDNGVVIRTVGYSHNGVTPAKAGNFYNPNPPDDKDLEKCSGELFLGSYTFNGVESRTYGVDFAARPTSFSFSYSYIPDHDSSQGSVEIVVYAKETNEVLIRRKVILTPASTLTDKTITFPRYKFGVEAGKLSIRFLSSDLDEGEEIGIHVPKGEELDQGFGTWNFANRNINQDAVKSVAIGSVLTVSNLRFEYGEKQNK